ncbi:MAG: hypothetical protein ACOYK8_01600 [Alphaproteobacteria bacterium]
MAFLKPEQQQQLVNAFGGADSESILCMFQPRVFEGMPPLFRAWFHKKEEWEAARQTLEEVLHLSGSAQYGDISYYEHNPKQGVYFINIHAGTDVVKGGKEPPFFQALREVLELQPEPGNYLMFVSEVFSAETKELFQENHFQPFLEDAAVIPPATALPISDWAEKITNNNLSSFGNRFHTGGFTVLLDEYLKLEAANGNVLTQFSREEASALLAAIEVTAEMDKNTIGTRESTARSFNGAASQRLTPTETVNKAIKVDMVEALEAYLELQDNQPKLKAMAIAGVNLALDTAKAAGGLNHQQTKLAQGFHPHLLENLPAAGNNLRDTNEDRPNFGGRGQSQFTSAVRNPPSWVPRS